MQQHRVKSSPRFLSKIQKQNIFYIHCSFCCFTWKTFREIIHQDCLFGVHLLPSSEIPKPIKSLNMQNFNVLTEVNGHVYTREQSHDSGQNNLRSHDQYFCVQYNTCARRKLNNVLKTGLGKVLVTLQVFPSLPSQIYGQTWGYTCSTSVSLCRNY